ncbi:hypothetical protein MASR1M66_04270 [Aminivibrio sp.]
MSGPERPSPPWRDHQREVRHHRRIGDHGHPLCLATDLMDLKDRIKKIVVGYTYDGQAVTVEYRSRGIRSLSF